MNPLLIAYQSFVEDWQDIIGPSSLDIFEGGYFLGKRRAAADLAKAREEGRRELANEIKAAAKLNPAGEEFWSETRDVYIIGARVLDALLAEKEEK
jgi:hypothetical protein